MPEKIWVWHDLHSGYPRVSSIPVTDKSVTYVRADLYDQLQAEIADLKARLEEAETKVNVTDSWLRKIIGHHAMYEGQDRNATSREYAQHALDGIPVGPPYWERDLRRKQSEAGE